MDNKMIFNKGIYNNIDIMENTLDSFNAAFNNNYTIKTKLQVLKDNNFILLEDNALEKLMNLKDNIKNMSYEDIDYISKYNVLKLEDFVKNINNNKVFLEVSNMSKKNINLLLKIIGNLKENIVILSMCVRVLKFFRKCGFKVSLMIKKKNKRLLNVYFKPDFYCIDNGLLDRKKIKKLKEEFYVIANDVDYKNVKEVLEIYNNAIICR